MSKVKIAVFGLVFLGGFLWFFLSGKISDRVPFDRAHVMKLIRDVVRKDGGLAGKKFFLSTYGSLDPGTLHELEHILGSEIFKKEGIEGISLCDDAHLFGCYHGFVATALSGSGTTVLSALEQVCQQQISPISSGGCFHGIGHGLLAHSGYSQTVLVDVLRLCRNLNLKEAKEGCYSGVFMEFNTQTMQKSLPIPPVELDKPTALCDALEAEYRSMCYFELPGLWQRRFGDDIAYLGSLCTKAQNDGKRACFSGLGQLIVGISRFNIGQARAGCALMPTNEGKIACLEKTLEQFEIVQP